MRGRRNHRTSPRGDDDAKDELKMRQASGEHEEMEQLVRAKHAWPEDRPTGHEQHRADRVEDSADQERPEPPVRELPRQRQVEQRASPSEGEIKGYRNRRRHVVKPEPRGRF